MDFEPRFKTARARHRIDGLINALFPMIPACNLSWKLLADGIIAGERHLLVCDHRNHAAQRCPFNPPRPSQKSFLTYVSYNGCVVALWTFAPLLAYLSAALPKTTNIQEAHLWGVMPTQRVRLSLLSGNGFDDVANIHSMFKITESRFDTISSFYLDPTAPQYGREQGQRAVSTYPVDLGHPNSRYNSHERLGTEYDIHLHELQGRFGSKPRRDPLTILKDEALTRTTNNEVYKVFLRLGGPTILLDMEDADWSAARNGIINALVRGLFGVCTRFDSVQARSYEELRDRYKAITKDCLGEGHRKCVEALEEVYCLPLMKFLHL